MSNEIEITPEEVLEHFGVPGMRWGQRRAARLELNSAIANAKADVATSKENLNVLKGHRREQNIKTAKTVFKVGAVAAVVAGGAIAASKILNKKGPIPVKEMSPLFSARGKDWSVSTNSAEAFKITMDEMARRKGG